MRYPAIKIYGENINIYLSEMSKSERPIYCMIHLYDILGKGKLYQHSKKINDYRCYKGGTGRTQRIFRKAKFYWSAYCPL